MLQLDSSNCQFFGALTFTVKVNALDPNAADIDISQLIHQVLEWYIISKQKSYKPFVVKKLLSTLSLLFVKFPSSWNTPLATLAAIHVTGTLDNAISNVEDSEEITTIVGRMRRPDVMAVLEFSVTLLEDLSTNNITSVLQIEVNNIINTQVSWYVPLLGAAFKFLELNQQELELNQASCDEDDDNELSQTIFNGLELWIVYFSNQKISIAPLQPFCSNILRLLGSTKGEEIYVGLCDFVRNIYSGSNRYWVGTFKAGLRDYLVTTGKQLVTVFPQLEEEDGKINSFIKLVIAYCTDETVNFLKDPAAQPQFQVMVDYLLLFSQKTKISLVDDSLSTELLEFWSMFVEEIVSGGYLSSLGSTSEIQTYITKIIDVHWYKIRLPEQSIAATWNKDAWEKFRLFRIDFCDFLELVYPLIGISLFENLTRQLIDTLLISDNKDWESIECFLYGINALSDLIDDNGREYEYFKRLLDTSLFSDLTTCQNIRIRLTPINLIGSYYSFFEREDGRPYIANSLDYLFKSLVFPSLSLNAAKSIQKLCSSTRKYLKHMIGTFLTIYRDMNLFSSLDNTSHEKIVYSMSCIIQSIDEIEKQKMYLEQLMTVITSEISIAISNTKDLTDLFSLRVRSLLKCIEKLGKGLQVPDEQDEPSLELLHQESKFWSENSDIRNRILLILKELSLDRALFNQDFEICETCCCILKAGFSELVETAFWFPTEVIINYICEKFSRGPPSCTSLLIDLARCLLTREQGRKEKDASGLGVEYIDILLNLFFSVNILKTYEPDAQVGTLKLVTQLLSNDYYRRYLFQGEKTLIIIETCIQLMNCSDRFVLRAASQFWVKFINIGGDFKPRVQEILQLCGPVLTKVLVEKISGDCARSELDYYCDVIKRIIFRYSLISKPWFTDAIVDNPFPALSRLDSRTRSQFLHKLFALRGSRETNHAVKDLWLACRGMIDYT